MKYLLLTTLLTFSLGSFACEEIKIAHDKLLESNFSVNKNFSLSMDNENKIKLTNFIEYNHGSLSHSKEDVLFVAKDFKYEEDNTEHFLISDFTCENIEIENEKVTINFALDDKNYTSYFLYQKEKLIPVRTIVEAEVSILFMSWDIKSIADYSNFKQF
ncbi:hypothetical protein H4J59_08170 [Colwellia sp. MB02u-10]|uniref:hypothetical protein n=1 Tax=Colwellia sp. MB02u-10 TaxID=2759828 RepID=UPI0015F4735D|nr:hypothetical protein [Colwellia sp. MB02u-10]MBA6340963.1 hypothetical protein [Colwellia sp. MB02u-10]